MYLTAVFLCDVKLGRTHDWNENGNTRSASKTKRPLKWGCSSIPPACDQKAIIVRIHNNQGGESC